MFTYSETEPFCGELKRRLLQQAPRGLRAGPASGAWFLGLPQRTRVGRRAANPVCLVPARAGRAVVQSWKSRKK